VFPSIWRDDKLVKFRRLGARKASLLDFFLSRRVIGNESVFGSVFSTSVKQTKSCCMKGAERETAKNNNNIAGARDMSDSDCSAGLLPRIMAAHLAAGAIIDGDYYIPASKST
jgi:hypothetical protein